MRPGDERSRYLGGFVDWLVVVGGALFNAAIIGYLARKLLDAPVGWPRTLVLSIGVNFGITPLVNGVLRALHLAPVVGHRASGAAEFLIIGLVVCWVLVAEVIALAILEAVVPTGSIPNPLGWLRALPAGARRGVRYTQILRIAARHGLGAYIGRRRARDTPPNAVLAASLRQAFTEAGVTFVKLGQMLSTRPDLLPAEYIVELAQLQTDVPAESWAAVEGVLQEELGPRLTAAFDSIDREPIAAASVGQVHTARLADGTDVVVKIQRPAARTQVTADLDIVMRLARMLERRAAWAVTLGVRNLAEGFAASLAEELDYRVELANMQAVSASSPDLVVPRGYPELSGRRVLVMQRLDGRSLSATLAHGSDVLDVQRHAMAAQLLDAVLRQVIVTGVFHADLHPGNIFVQPDHTLALLDFGAVGRLDLGDRLQLAGVLMAVDEQDSATATTALTDLLAVPDDLDHRDLERDIGQLIMRFGTGVGGGARMFAELFPLVLRHRLGVPAPIAAAFRALAALDGSLSMLAPGFDMIGVARAKSRAIFSDVLDPARVRNQVRLQIATILPMLQRLPRRIDHLTNQLETGRFTMNARILADPQDRVFVTRLVQQLILAVLTAALVIGGVLLVVADNGPAIVTGVPLNTFIGAIFLLFGFVLGARVVVRAFRRGS